jgi:hypothetical protein
LSHAGVDGRAARSIPSAGSLWYAPPMARRTPALTLAGLAACSALLVAGQARADAATWFHTGAGAVAFKHGADSDVKLAPSLAFDLGVGTTTRADYIFGGYFRVLPMIGEGADLALMARFANQDFQQGWFGFAFDAGAYQRFWGDKSTGFMGQAVLGGPFGLQLAALGSVGSHSSWSVGGTLGIDLVRLVVDRQHHTDWWPNPRPSDAMYESAALRW